MYLQNTLVSFTTPIINGRWCHINYVQSQKLVTLI
ncbi:MAG: hypothetical protein ACJA01_001254, partial [Saprospiraceae bacterium]